MKKLHTFVRAVEALALFLALWIEQWAQQYLFKSHSAPLALLVVTGFVGLVAVVKLAHYTMTHWVDTSPQLRKLILGDDYIEGYWFNKVQTSTSALFGLLRIIVTEAGVRVHGEQFDASGKLTATWESQMADYHNNNLRYAYLVKYVGRPDSQDIYGFSDISFSKVSGCPMEYSGRFQDISPNDETANTFTFVGFRIVNDLHIADFKGSRKQAAISALIGEASKKP